jgi:hypothetical protein
VAELLTGAAGKDHVGHDKVEAAVMLIVNLDGVLHVEGGKNFEAGVLENAAGGFADERLILDEKNRAPAGEIVCGRVAAAALASVDMVGLRSVRGEMVLESHGILAYFGLSNCVACARRSRRALRTEVYIARNRRALYFFRLTSEP